MYQLRHTEEEALYERIGRGMRRGIIRCVVRDVIALGTESQKRRALTRMTDQFDPSFSPAINALQDDSNAIRVQAACCKD